MPAFKILALVGCLVLAVSCAGRPDRLLEVNAARAPGTSEVEMLVATTRLRAEDPAILFTGDRARTISLADIAISIPPDAARKVGEVQWPKRIPGDPATEFVATRADVIDEPTARRRLAERLRSAGSGHVFLFVHGYNNRFEDAVFTFAQFVHDSRAPAVPVLFTWPSRGELLAYGYDRESANYSRSALELLLRRLDENPAVREITVLAHSMGNWVTLEALRQMSIRSGRVPGKIDQVVLAAPDVDVDVFRSQIDEIGSSGPRFILLASRDDQALALSRRLWGGTVRLGAVDPGETPYKEDLDRAGVTVIDLTELAGDGINHAKFASVPEVVRMIGGRIAEGQALGAGRGTIGDRIGLATSSGAAAVGGAVGLVVTAPLAVLHGDERDTFGQRVRAVGDDTRNAVGAVVCPTGPTDLPVPAGCPDP